MNPQQVNPLLTKLINESSLVLSASEIRRCELVARRINETRMYYYGLSKNTNFSVKFNPVDYSLQLSSELKAFEITKCSNIFYLYTQDLFKDNLKTGEDIVLWNELLSSLVTALHDTRVEVRLVLKKQAVSMFSEYVDREIDIKLQQRRVAKDQGDFNTVDKLSKEIDGLDKMFNQHKHNVKLVCFPEYNKGFLYPLTSNPDIPGYSNKVIHLGKGQIYGDSSDQYLFDSGICINDVRYFLDKNTSTLIEGGCSPDQLAAHSRDFGRSFFDIQINNRDVYRIEQKKQRICYADEVKASTVRDTEKSEVFDDD